MLLRSEIDVDPYDSSITRGEKIVVCMKTWNYCDSDFVMHAIEQLYSWTLMIYGANERSGTQQSDDRAWVIQESQWVVASCSVAFHGLHPAQICSVPFSACPVQRVTTRSNSFLSQLRRNSPSVRPKKKKTNFLVFRHTQTQWGLRHSKRDTREYTQAAKLPYSNDHKGISCRRWKWST